jgi:hypothetical protein
MLRHRLTGRLRIPMGQYWPDKKSVRISEDGTIEIDSA